MAERPSTEDAADALEAVADVDESEEGAVEAIADELDAEDRTDLVPAIVRWDEHDQQALVDAVEPWDDDADLIDAIVRWDDYEEEFEEPEFVALDPETAHPTQLDVVRDLKAYFGREDPGPLEEDPGEEFLETEFFDFSYLEEWTEIERYWVNEPFAYVTILFDVDSLEYQYRIVEPALDEFERYVRQDLVSLLRNSLMYQEVADADKDREVVFAERAQKLIRKHAATVNVGSLQKVYYYLARDFLRYGPIDGMMNDAAIEDISCDGADVPVYVYDRRYRNLRSNVVFEERRLNSFAVRLAQRAGKSLSISDPLVDASLPDGSRIQITLGGEISARGSNFTIRKFADVPFSPVDLVRWNTFSAEEMAYFWLAIENNRSLIFAGGTGSGKTTSMNAISFFIPMDSKLITIEDTREIDLPHDNWIQSVVRRGVGEAARGEISMYDLLQAALRQRPEYLVVGEIRTEQRVALTFFQAMSTGHTAYTTLHADSVETAFARLRNAPLSIPTQMLQELDIISIQRQSYLGDERVRRNRSITELSESRKDPDTIELNTVYEWDPETDEHERRGDSWVLSEIARERGWSEQELDRELEQRTRVIEYLVENDVIGIETVASTLRLFTKDRQRLLEMIEEDELDPDELDVDVERGPTQVFDQHDEFFEELESDVESAVPSRLRSTPPDDRSLDLLADELESAEAPSAAQADEGDDTGERRPSEDGR